MLRLAIYGFAAFGAAAGAGPGLAQVVLDGSLGRAGALAGPDARVPEDAGARAGPNLLHSFSRFDVPSGGSVTFEGGADIDAIVGRVTGGAQSRIDGLLASEAPNADLFLINPAGVVFGEGAELDLPGSLHLSTADSAIFPNGETFDAAGGPAPAFVSAPPEAFGFLGPENGAIAFEGASVELEEGAALTISAGAIRIMAEDDPAIEIESGAVRLTAIDGAGRVTIVDGALDGTGGSIALIGLADREEEDDDEFESAEGDDDGDEPDPLIDVSGDDPGAVRIRGGSLTVRDFSVAADVEGGDGAPRTAIEIDVSGDADFDGESQFASISSGGGRAGDVVVRAGRLVMAGDAELLSDVREDGAGGDVSIEADLVRLDGDAEIAADVDEEATGAGGGVRIAARRIEILGESEISSDTSGPGAGGSVRLTASEEILIVDEAGVFTDARDAGDAGSAFLSAPAIRMRGGAVSAESSGTGAGGGVFFTGGSALLSGGARVTAESAGPAPAGDLSFALSGDLILSNASIATTSAEANGGRIDVAAGGIVDLRLSSIETSVASGVGQGGDVSVSAGALVLDQSLIAANAVDGAGGDVTASADAIFFGANAAITATSERNVDGAISLDAPEADVAGQLAPLTATLINVEDLLKERCAARAPEQAGTIGVAPASSLPDSPLGGLAVGFGAAEAERRADGPVFAAFSLGCGG